jgi:hypothetical protein
VAVHAEARAVHHRPRCRISRGIVGACGGQDGAAETVERVERHAPLSEICR